VGHKICLIALAISLMGAGKPTGQRVRASSQVQGKNLYRILIAPPLMVTTKNCLEVVVDMDVLLDRVGKKLWFWVGTPDVTSCDIVSIVSVK